MSREVIVKGKSEADELKAALAKLGYRWVYLVEGDSINHYTINDLPEYDAVWDVLERAALASPAGAGTPEPDGLVTCDINQTPHSRWGDCENPKPASAVPQAGAHTKGCQFFYNDGSQCGQMRHSHVHVIDPEDIGYPLHVFEPPAPPEPAPTVTPAATKTGMVMVEMPVSLARTFASNSPSPSGYDRSTDLLASACRKALAAAQAEQEAQ